ncbi:MAG: ATP-binding protein [Caldilineaceae bacterium]|nr:ATP-binding protein [Caldilineaceae bacterium]
MTQTPKPLPTTTSSFRDIIMGGFLYIDKTKSIYELIKDAKGAYFLSRPRRFGKSLLLSTLEELFRGNRDLFRGLWIDSSDYDWETHPVIRLDLSQAPVKTVEDLETNLKRALRRIAQQYQVTLVDGPAHAQFDDLIFALAQEKQVVILIDEYDNPLINNLTNLAEAKRIRDTLKGFYGVIKAMDRYVRIAFITGVSKFSKVSVFSELNNLDDLTFDGRAATMLGITQAELEHYFQDRLPHFAQVEDLTEEALLQKIREWYNGFRFTRVTESLYNPFSTMNLFTKYSFHNFWFESGTPSFLINLIKQQGLDPMQLEELTLREIAFSTYELENLDIIPLLYQTGYLTIKDYDQTQRLYTLAYPNLEVEESFITWLLGSYSELGRSFGEIYIWDLIDALKTQSLDQFFKILSVFFANVPYDLHINREGYYQTIFYLIFMMFGFRVDAEVKTNDGRIDAVVELTDHIYLFEFKLDKSAKEALAQIKSHAYYQKYLLHGKPITCIGANFNTLTRTVDDWATEAVPL